MKLFFKMLVFIMILMVCTYSSLVLLIMNNYCTFERSCSMLTDEEILLYDMCKVILIIISAVLGTIWFITAAKAEVDK